ncbi:OstA-like protein [Arcticibacter sp. MXS-1]|uniref:OstA-like protein n=1 Tax=Arcticibacter sp. MXS-1 TaxID=3341726 RepID=UPI0035A8F8FA
MGNTSGARFIRPVFAHEGSTLAADSADYNQAANAFDAYGHVVITQPDGTVIYSDVLNYDGNTRVAILTNNVRMVDKDAILTTNYLKYNMGTKIGTYIGGGKIENGQNVLTSKNGYYFANSRDAYFRYDVVVNTPDALIKTDTLKYNTESKVSWFYGPTNIYGKGQNKESKLYTEKGRYNTLTDQAWFGKKNHYTEGSKSLKGDSLYYDGKAGFGKAINNITFLDTVQKVILKGNQGIYRKRDESALVTRNAYVVIETEQDSATVDSIWMTADTLITKLIPLKQFVKATNEELKSDQEIATDPVIEGEGIVVQSEPAPAERKPESATVAPPAESRKERRKRKQQEDKKQEDKKPAKDDKAAAVVTAADSSKVAIPPEQKKGAVDGVGTTDSSKVAVSQTRKKGGIAGASPSDSSKVATPQAQKKEVLWGLPLRTTVRLLFRKHKRKGLLPGLPLSIAARWLTAPRWQVVEGGQIA